MSDLQKIIEKLNRLSYLLHLKQCSIPSNNNFSSVDSERIFSVIHQFIEQLLMQKIEQKKITLSEINQLFQVEIIDDEKIMTDAKYYLEQLDRELTEILNKYTQVIQYYQQNDNGLTLGILCNQNQRLKLLIDEFRSKKANYPNELPDKQRILNRRNEPFDSEAILDDLL
ncbi:hypothetical protein [Enterococcus dongliensis]|uniref:hypothetical protein n=1 Tax=Enterococcus dongliensis TaxID=2559925 RepID=UPI002892206E|nr:hypothetical protein [Enterococcus dongliensis]MDT2612879.1 hypothetical protein [Enterococcus dongliensis]